MNICITGRIKLLKKIHNFLNKNDIGEPPWDYDFLLNLDESKYPKYLAKIFNYRTGEKLPLCRELRIENGKLRIDYKIDKKRCKTFNQKLQWIKLYGITDLMRKCTDKVAVRDYVKEKIGEEYLKPVLQICDSFDEIDFEKLPNSFVLKCNHGCKWQFIIKDKNEFLKNKRLFDIVQQNMIGWLEQEFWVFEGFELNYKNLEHKFLIEKYLPSSRYIQIFCFNQIPQIYVDIQLKGETKICTYNEDFSYSDLVLKNEDEEYMCKIKADSILKQTIVICKKLSKSFKFVRVDLMVNENKLYFEELTFSPYSGFCSFTQNWNKKLGDWIEIE